MSSTNRERSERAIKNARREFDNALRSFDEGDYAGALKYFQESLEYAVKGVLMAFGVDYPKVHEVGRFLHEVEEKCPQWFVKELPAIAGITDSLARGRPRFRYPYEHPSEESEALAREVRSSVERALRSCESLIRQLFR
ncbi:MAG: HEPN domain-containing protein [Candidatus Bathyarchaeia archaeon]